MCQIVRLHEGVVTREKHQRTPNHLHATHPIDSIGAFLLLRFPKSRLPPWANQR
jgi:hypothetical protein